VYNAEYLGQWLILTPTLVLNVLRRLLCTEGRSNHEHK